MFFVLLVSTTCVEVEGRENEQQSLVVSRLQHGRALDIIVQRIILTTYTHLQINYIIYFRSLISLSRI